MLRSKHKRDPSVRVNYTIHIIEIRPWPPSESLRSLQTVLLQWESGNNHSGAFLSTAVDSRIVFNESFKLPLVLYQDKKKDHDKFQKNNLEFTLYSHHNNKSRGQLLGTAVLNLADYGVIEHVISLDTLVNFKKGIGSNYNSIQPVLVILVEPVEIGSSSLSKEPSLDESGMAYFTDDEDDVVSPNFEASGTSLSSRIQKIYERSMTSVKKKSDNPYVRSYSLSTSHRDMFMKPDTFTTLSEEVVCNSSQEVIPDSKHIITENAQQPLENKPSPVDIKEVRGEPSECEGEWKGIVEILEEELRETAAIEIGLYSVVAEHVSSVNKDHVAARRLSRFYSDACKSGSKVKRASAARAALCGLVVVSKSCGNDVARLTFWLSNSIMLRTIVIQISSELPHSNNELDDLSTCITALEKIESWLFSRIVESVWWQTFTPHMHPVVAEDLDVAPVSSMKKPCSRSNSLIYHGREKFSTELWKKTFKDACASLCPIWAGGHECGCLTVLLMEQLVDRMDTAMFNAILRESDEEMPTDPLSDPITESKVLPILAGKSSFCAGVELKNSASFWIITKTTLEIETWSRCLADIFGLEYETRENSDVLGDSKGPKSFKVFRLLHALSDLMMLPFGMLADVYTRREVCPLLGPAVIKRVLNNHIPDEFCPDPIPQNIIDALDTEEVSVLDEESIFPCPASPTIYSPPSAALLNCAGDVGNQMLQRLSLLKKSYTSDDELDELDSPFTSIIPDNFQSSPLAILSSIPKEEGGKSIIRYQLLLEIWRDDE